MEKASSQANWAPEPVRVCFRWLGSSTWDKDLIFWLVNIRWTYFLGCVKTSCENSNFGYASAFKCWKNIERILKKHWKNIERIFDSILPLAQHRAQDTALKFLLVWIWSSGVLQSSVLQSCVELKNYENIQIQIQSLSWRARSNCTALQIQIQAQYLVCGQKFYFLDK